MVRCSTPDTLIGLGGGGSRVVYRFMEQDWILEEVLGNGPSEGDHGNDVLRAATIDTATDEEWHEDRVRNVEAAISDAIEASEYEKKDKYLEFDGPTILPEEIPYGWKNEELTSSTSIGGLRRGVGLNSWWLENGRDPLENVNAKGFGTGVDRLRSVSKALYHIADYNGVEPIGVRAEGDVAIVTSLGGGTGSGLALDLASDLNHRNNVDSVHLYAVLPRSGAGVDVKTNAHAALSELEYAELTGESPFTTITLLPHLDEVTDRNEAFEMAMVRTIVARHNGGDEFEKIRPKSEDRATAPDYAPFTVASPVTLRFDFEAKERAKEVVERTLDRKREELRKERDIHEVVGKYLKNAFQDTAGAELAGTESRGTLEFGDDGYQRAIELRRRIEEDLGEKFLHSEALRVANLGELVDEINAEFADNFDDETIGIPDGADEHERATEFVEIVPERLEDPLDAFGLTERDGSKYKLVEVLKQEIRNVAERRDLYEAISRITAGENPDLSEKEAETIRTVLAEVVLDDDIKFPSKRIRNPKLRDEIENLENELADYETEYEALESQYREVASDIRSKRNEWYNEASSQAEKLAAINRDGGTVETVLKDLSEEIQRQCRNVNEAGDAELDHITLDLGQIGPLGGEDESINGVAPINAKLRKIGVDPIPAQEIEEAFQNVKEARRLEINHGRGLIPDDNAEEFVTTVDRATRSGWFSINEDDTDTSVEDEFVCGFNGGQLERSDEIERVERAAVDAIADAFVEAFTADGSGFESHEPDDENGVAVPQGSSPVTVKQSLTSALKASTETDETDLLNDVMPVSGIKPSNPAEEPFGDDGGAGSDNPAPMLQLVDAYLDPIRQQYVEIQQRRDVLTDGDDAPGLIDRMKKLRGLAEGADTVDVSLPTPDDRQRDAVYGSDFVENYHRIYEFDLDDSFKYEDDDNPYVVPMETQAVDLAGDPEDISDTDIIENRAGDIEDEFRRETRSLTGDDPRAPYTLELQGTAEYVEGMAYEQLRIRQSYLSRGFEGNLGIGRQYDEVFEKYDDLNNVPVESHADMYNADRHPYGWADDVSMVTFVGGIFLDNISLTSEANGYRDNYVETANTSEFPGSHHTIGLAAMWDRWRRMGEWVSEVWEAENPDSDADFGGYVYREKLFDPTNNRFIEDLKHFHETDGESAKELFLDALTTAAYENTVDVEAEPEDSDGPDYTI